MDTFLAVIVIFFIPLLYHKVSVLFTPKEVISAYADFEQLVGAVDTLFGDASQTVQNYAANAFKTAGMSANEYM